MIALLTALALAADIPDRPAPPEPAATDCPRNIPLRAGEPIPPELVDDAGRLRCTAIAVPPADYADLLATEVWGEQLHAAYRLDAAAWDRDRAWYEAQLEPVPWHQTAAAARWGGRIEALGAVVLAVVVLDQARGL